ncbi:MAG: DUF5103 domain-containing protein [Saprospiraceae bacterium]|nr:DUF5103 domain-containing protein [Saprospiraceae bacterium]
MKYFFSIIFTLSSFWVIALDNYNFDFTNNVYDNDIKTVTLEINNLPTNFPVMSMSSGQFVMLKFDDLLNEERTLYYRIIHCDKDWNQSSLRELDYLIGFNDERLRKYEYSANTRLQYIHYWQQFPNKDTKFKVSGNYLLVIYEDNIDQPIITRRFVITENVVGTAITSIYPSDVQNIRYKQELQVNVALDKFKMRNPMEEVSIVMLQNENWENAIHAKPSFFGGTNLRFNKLKTFEWWGLAEYREFDTRSLIRLGRNIKFIERRTDGTEITLHADLPRRNKVHLATFDFNGRFFVENFERAGTRRITDVLDEYAATVSADQTLRQTLRDSLLAGISTRNSLLDSEYQAEERNIRADYTNNVFFLDDDINLKSNQDIYILGSMNNWMPSEEYRMRYDANRDMYTTQVLMKQGYYNYYYGIVENGEKIDYATMEGSWNETENDYQVLIYFRGLGDLYDRVIGYQTYNTNSNLLRN